MSIATHALYLAATGKTVADGKHICLFCGCHHADSTHKDRVIADTFTHFGMCRALHSTDVCPACTHYFTHRWQSEAGKRPLEYRLNSLLITPPTWQIWQRKDMRANIEHWMEHGFPGGVCVVSLAKKKHLLPLASVNPPTPSGCPFGVQVELDRVSLSKTEWATLAGAFDALLDLGFLKGEILSGNYSAHSLRKIGPTKHFRHEAIIAGYRPSALLTLVSYVTMLDEDEAAQIEEA